MEHSITLFIPKYFFFLQGLTLLELTFHVEGKAVQLRWECFGKIKIALAGTDTSSLLKILEGCFGYMDLDTSQSTASTEKAEKEVKEVASTPSNQIPATLSSSGGLATTELVFPIKSITAVTAGLPETYLPICGPETLSQYCCQFPSCYLEFSQKAAACNHVCHDHLNVALACLYCSFECNSKMWWYSASTWECHTLGHSKEKLPIHPNDPAFSQQFSKTESISSTSGSASKFPHAEAVNK